MDANVKYLCCGLVETVEYFKLLGMRHGDTNAALKDFESTGEIVHF